jgi:hypothetical protein
MNLIITTSIHIFSWYENARLSIVFHGMKRHDSSLQQNNIKGLSRHSNRKNNSTSFFEYSLDWDQNYYAGFSLYEYT